jgi:tripartite-type tricarboxylate transporter receptor subunit TctC
LLLDRSPEHGVNTLVRVQLFASAERRLTFMHTQIGSVPNYLAPADLTKLVKAESVRLTQVATEAGWAQK